MKKGVSLQVEVYIEGDDPPANDFNQTGQRFLMQVLAAGMRGVASPYLLGVKRITPLEGSDADGDGDTDDSSDNSQNTGFIASWGRDADATGTSGTSGTSGTPGTGSA